MCKIKLIRSCYCNGFLFAGILARMANSFAHTLLPVKLGIALEVDGLCKD